MACFIVPATEAIVTTAVTKIIEKKEANNKSEGKMLIAPKLKHLNGFLWGGSALLAFEHFWHGEIQPFFPFLTAASSPEATAEMLHEMSTVGVTMAIFTTIFWGITTFVSVKQEQKADSCDSKLQEAK